MILKWVNMVLIIMSVQMLRIKKKKKSTPMSIKEIVSLIEETFYKTKKGVKNERVK